MKKKAPKKKEQLFKETYFVKGITCSSCEELIIDAMLDDERISSASINNGKLVLFSKKPLSSEELNEALTGTQYSLHDKEIPEKKLKTVIIGIIIAILFLFFFFSLEDALMERLTFDIESTLQLSVIFFLGLAASFSTCIAIAGGLLIGISTKYVSMYPNLTRYQKFYPHFFFIIGRILSYTILGALIGYIGSLLTLSSVASGIITILAAMLMILIGLQLLGILKPASLLPKSVSSLLATKSPSEKPLSRTSIALFGAGTFFLPCGFTQAMQLYVLGSGDPFFGAMVMMVFVLGTTPSFVGIGLFTSNLKKEWLSSITIISGILIVSLGLFLLPSGLQLASFGSSSSERNEFFDENLLPPIVDGMQVVEMSVSGLSYSPHQFLIQKGIPVKFVVDGTRARGCGLVLTIPKFNVFEFLSQTEKTIIYFTPTKVEEIPFHCSMAMTTPHAKFVVVDNEKASLNTMDETKDSAIEDSLDFRIESLYAHTIIMIQMGSENIFNEINLDVSYIKESSFMTSDQKLAQLLSAYQTSKKATVEETVLHLEQMMDDMMLVWYGIIAE